MKNYFLSIDSKGNKNDVFIISANSEKQAIQIAKTKIEQYEQEVETVRIVQEFNSSDKEEILLHF